MFRGCVSEIQIISKLWPRTYAVRREILVKLWAEILFKFQWQIEKLCPEISISPLDKIKNGIDQAAKSYNKCKKDTKTLRTRKEWNL